MASLPTEEKKAPKPKPYVSPALTVHGDIAVVTQALGKSSKNYDGGGKVPIVKTH